jgi:hypothetical protein
MPTVRGIPGPYRFFFYSFDCAEPRHVHARREQRECKYWIEPIRLAANHGFSARELRIIRAYIEWHHERFVQAWEEHCG